MLLPYKLFLEILAMCLKIACDSKIIPSGVWIAGTFYNGWNFLNASLLIVYHVVGTFSQLIPAKSAAAHTNLVLKLPKGP